jgi:hypothetical protein
MRAETEERIFRALERKKGKWSTIHALAKLTKTHYYAIQIFVARHRLKLERMAFGSKKYYRLKA